MGWRLHVSNQPIHAVQLLGGNPAQLAVWTSPHEARFYAEENGAFYGSLSVSSPADMHADGETWQAFVETLRAPNHVFLPVVDTGRTIIHTTNDGRLRVYREHDDCLTLSTDGRRMALRREGDAPIVAAGLDRELGTVAVLSADGLLHIYLQHVYVGAYPVEVDNDPVIPTVLLPDATGIVFVADATRIQVLDMIGQVQHTLTAPFGIGSVACSPDGRQLVVGDRDHGLIRLYNAQLGLIRQQAALDLLENAPPLELLSPLPESGTRPNALAITSEGGLAFVLGGVLCLTHVSGLAPLPQPRTLF